jgi:peptide-methionine (S)-S-oxide reductase
MNPHGWLQPISLIFIAIALVVILIVRLWRRMAFTNSRKEPIPAPIHDIVAPASGWEAGEQATAVFAGGCFWGSQSVFQRVKGVIKTTVGYSGGESATAIYRAVTSMETGHAEAIEIVYDPSLISFGTLLRIFFSVMHDPTQLNRQGADVGTQYRSHIFYTTEEQREVTEAYVKQLDDAHIFSGRIVTQITPLIEFFPGEDYHQDYAHKNPNNPYIQVCDIPKIASLKQQFPELFEEYTL